MLTAQSRIVLCLSALLCSGVGVARAETPTSPIAPLATPTIAPLAAPAPLPEAPEKADALQRARERLEHYDLDGGSTFAELQALATVAATDPEPAHALEARFLRAAAAADLIVIAAKLERPMLLDSLASALSCEPNALLATVKSELQAAAVAHYQAPAKNALAMLDSIASNGSSAALVGVLRDYNAVEAAAKAAHGSDPSAALAALSDDPCEKRDGSKIASQCALFSFDAASRRSLATLTNAAGSNASLQKAATNGDPLADALAKLATEHAAALDGVVVCALPALDDRASDKTNASVTLPASLRTTSSSSTLALRITASEVRALVTPCLGLRANAADEPEQVELAWSKLALPATYRPYIAPITGLEETLTAQTHDAALGRVVVMADADVQAHVLARALVSLPSGTHGARVSLLTRQESGELHASPIEIARTEENTPAVHIRIRLGGYSLYVGDHFEDIPRVKTDAGFSFDRATLEQRLASQAPSAIQISFMPEVRSDEVLAALSSTADRSQRVQLMIP